MLDFDQLRELTVLRRACVDSRTADTNRLKALARRFVGWEAGAEEQKRQQRCAVANEVAGVVMNGGVAPIGQESACLALVEFGGLIGATIEALNVYIRALEKRIEALVKPEAIWMKWGGPIRGLGIQNLATLLAEAGNPGNYPKKGHLWKRFGLHLNGEGRAARATRGEKLDFSPFRRSHAIVAAGCLLRSGNEHYRALYDARRTVTAERYPDWTKGHSHNDAQRIVAKRLLLDLWRAWRAAAGEDALGPEPADEAIAASPTLRRYVEELS